MRSLVLSLALLSLFAAAPCVAAETYRFTYRPGVVGEQSQQLVTLNLNLSVAIKKDGALVENSQRQLTRKQQRTTHVLEVNEHGPSKMKVTYQLAEKGLGVDHKPVAASAQEVSGKTYLAARVGKELVVTDERGGEVSSAEREIVAHDLATLGLPNPIGAFFNGKTFRVGQRIELPTELAKELLGFTDAVGEVKRFEMTFAEVKQIQGSTCAVFKTAFEATSQQAGSMSMHIRGQLLLDTDSCMAAIVQLSGPVTMSETRGSGEGQYRLNTTGTLSLSAQALRATRR